ncbi:MAG: inosine monophosphate cyclohydrolase [Clostridiales bacterium]|nr:inosine monophosphate cyclohydrolase [Clostridiales bacterium]
MKISDVLLGNTCPGRGIIVGSSGGNAVAVYFITGRSVNSRTRVFERTDDGICTKAFDEKKLTDPSLIIYRPVRLFEGRTIITNGDQTDTIREFLKGGRSFYDAVKSRTFEPDPPNWTPRISALIDSSGKYTLSIVKNIGGEVPLHCFYEYTSPAPGAGHFIRTYMCDGAPLPPFEGEPVPVEITGGLEAFANSVWNALDEANRVALYALEIETASGSRSDIIINKYGSF